LKRSEEARRVAESELAATKEVVVRNAQALADSLGRSKALEEELSQLQGVARSAVTEVLGPRLW
jgi:RecA/RadA recombinase